MNAHDQLTSARPSLLRRLGYVFLTYVTRPLIWVVGGIYLFGLVMILWSALDRKLDSPRSPAYPEIWVRGRTLLISEPQGLRDYEQGKFDPSIALVHVIWPEFNADHLRQLRTCHHLRALRFERVGLNEISEEEISILGELQQLEMLSLAGCRLSPSVWKHIGRLPNLRYLDLSDCRLQGDYSGLESLSRLETLILGSPPVGEVTADDAPLLPELKRLPNLKTLVLWRLTGDHTLRVTDQLSNLIRDLRGIKSLRHLFVNEYAANFPGFTALQRDLPNVRVRPSFIVLNRPVTFIGIVFLDAVLMFLLAMQLQSQFSQAVARLIPGYAAPHVVPVVVIWAIGTVLHTIPFLVRDVSLIPAIGLSLLPWGVMSGIAITGMSSKIDVDRGLWLKIPAIFIAIGWVPLAAFLFQWNKSSIDWYLRGHELGWAWLFIVMAVTLSAAALRQTMSLNCIFAERGIHSPPISFDPAAMNVWKQEVYWRRVSSVSKPGWYHRWVGNRLERAIHSASFPGWRARCNLWIAGNQSNRVMPLLMAMVFTLTFACVPLVSSGELSSIREVLTLQSAPTLFLSIFLPDFPMILIVGIWRARRPLFATESLRAVSRFEFARQIAAALAWDLVPIAGIYLAILTWYTASADASRWTVAWTLAMLLFFIARWSVIYGLTLWSIVIRRDWVLVLTAVTTGYAAMFVNGIVVFLQGRMFGVQPLPPDMPDVGVLGLAGSALLMGIVGTLIARSAYQRWQTIELV